MINNKDKRYKLETTNWTRRQYTRKNIVFGGKYNKLDLLFLVSATISSSGKGWTMLDMRMLDINMQGTVLEGVALGGFLSGAGYFVELDRNNNEKEEYDTEG